MGWKGKVSGSLIESYSLDVELVLVPGTPYLSLRHLACHGSAYLSKQKQAEG